MTMFMPNCYYPDIDPICPVPRHKTYLSSLLGPQHLKLLCWSMDAGTSSGAVRLERARARVGNNCTGRPCPMDCRTSSYSRWTCLTEAPKPNRGVCQVLDRPWPTTFQGAAVTYSKRHSYVNCRSWKRSTLDMRW
jgi:hypothetical protein